MKQQKQIRQKTVSFLVGRFKSVYLFVLWGIFLPLFLFLSGIGGHIERNSLFYVQVIIASIVGPILIAIIVVALLSFNKKIQRKALLEYEQELETLLRDITNMESTFLLVSGKITDTTQNLLLSPFSNMTEKIIAANAKLSEYNTEIKHVFLKAEPVVDTSIGVNNLVSANDRALHLNKRVLLDRLLVVQNLMLEQVALALQFTEHFSNEVESGELHGEPLRVALLQHEEKISEIIAVQQKWNPLIEKIKETLQEKYSSVKTITV